MPRFPLDQQNMLDARQGKQLRDSDYAGITIKKAMGISYERKKLNKTLCMNAF